MLISFPFVRNVKCGVLCYAADNLEASVVGGFSACFSSKDVCRTCHIQHSDLEDNIHDFNEVPHKYWTEEEYNKIVESIEDEIEENEIADTEEVVSGNLFTEIDVGARSDSESEGDSDSSISDGDMEGGGAALNKRGINSECPLNCLQSFHSVRSFPPDVLHDIFEGVVPEDLLGIIRILAVKGWFSLDQYNIALAGLRYTSYEKNDKPCPVPTSSKIKKLKGKAVRQGFQII